MRMTDWRNACLLPDYCLSGGARCGVWAKFLAGFFGSVGFGFAGCSPRLFRRPPLCVRPPRSAPALRIKAMSTTRSTRSERGRDLKWTQTTDEYAAGTAAGDGRRRRPPPPLVPVSAGAANVRVNGCKRTQRQPPPRATRSIFARSRVRRRQLFCLPAPPAPALHGSHRSRIRQKPPDPTAAAVEATTSTAKGRL